MLVSTRPRSPHVRRFGSTALDREYETEFPPPDSIACWISCDRTTVRKASLGTSEFGGDESALFLRTVQKEHRRESLPVFAVLQNGSSQGIPAQSTIQCPAGSRGNRIRGLESLHEDLSQNGRSHAGAVPSLTDPKPQRVLT